MRKNSSSIVREMLLHVSLISNIITTLSLRQIIESRIFIVCLLLICIVKDVFDYLIAMFLWQDKREEYSSKYKSSGLLTWSFLYLLFCVTKIMTIVQLLPFENLLYTMVFLIFYFCLSRYRHNMCISENGWIELYKNDQQSILMLKGFSLLTNCIFMFLSLKLSVLVISILLVADVLFYSSNAKLSVGMLLKSKKLFIKVIFLDITCFILQIIFKIVHSQNNVFEKNLVLLIIGFLYMLAFVLLLKNTILITAKSEQSV